MSEPTGRPPSPVPVPWPLRPPYTLEPSRPLYNHVARDHEQQAAVQSRWDAEWDEFDRYYQQTRSRHNRTGQAHHRTAAPPMPPPPQQRQHDQYPHDPPADSRDGPRGGRERWRYLGRDYVRDSRDGEWVEAWKPTIHPVTDIYGIPLADPLYRSHLRYMPRESEPGDAQREQAAISPVDNQLTGHATGRPGIPPPHPGDGYHGSHTQPIDHGSATHSRPRSLSPRPMPYRPMDTHGDQGHAGHGYPGSGRSVQQDQRHNNRYPTQSNNARAPTGHVNPIGPDVAQQRHFPAVGQAPAGPLETREDPWEFVFGSKGYTTLAPGDERPFWWDWEE